MKPVKRWRRKERGFSLIEMAVATAIIGLVLTTLLSALALGIRNTVDVQLDNTGLQLARSQIESIKQQAFTTTISSYSLVSVPNNDYTISLTGTTLQAGLLQEIIVNITHPGGTTTLTSYKSKDLPPVVTGISVPTTGPTATNTPTPTSTPLPAVWAALASYELTADATPETVGAGGALTTNGTNIYGLRNATADNKNFGRYTIGSNSWTGLTAMPVTTGSGAALAWTGGDYIFGFQGGGNATFYRYQISLNAWAARTAPPDTIGAGGALAWDGSDGVYAFRGGNTKQFYRYSISGNSWATLADTPANETAGGALVYVSPYVYGFRGGGNATFWRYDIGLNTWSAMNAGLGTVDTGGALDYPGGDFIMAFRGAMNPAGNPSNRDDFWRYSISGNSWTQRPDALADVGAGGALAYLNNTHYAFRGASTADFWKFTANN